MKEVFRLRNFSESDAASLAYNANHFDVWKNVRDVFPLPYTQADAENFIAYAKSAVNEKIYAIDVEGKAVGAIGLNLKNDVYRYCGEIGYWIGPNYNGKGIVTSAVSQIVSFAFEEYNLLRLYAEVFEGNDASVRVLEKNQFVLEARFKSSVFKDNCIRNLLVFSRINSNWKHPQPPLLI